MANRLSLESIEQAARTIDPVFLHTPQFETDRLGAVLGCRLVVKVETVNPIRTFKGRGADYYAAGVRSGVRLVCASAGNFGQAMAYSCRKRNVPLTVFASHSANPYKLGRMKALGADVILRGEDFDAAKIEARSFVQSTPGAEFVEDGREPAISEGAGTIGMELSGLSLPLDFVVIPVGNGALIGGIGSWMKHASPKTRMIAVQSAGAPAMIESWRAGRVLETPSVNTIADGLGVRIPVAEAVSDMQEVVDDAILVDDDKLIRAMKLAFQDLGLVMEPSGAAGLAAILASPEQFAGRTVATVLTGANITSEQAKRWLFA